MKNNNSNMARKMIGTIKAQANYCSASAEIDVINNRVLNAMQAIDREQFVPDAYRKHVYNKGPIPIGYNQTIPPPFIVELMTNLADTAPDKIVLEVGTGSGFQAAILSLLVKKVYTIETIPELAKTSKDNLRKMGFNNIEVKCGNGYYGWEEKSPFDAIIISAAVPHIPQSLIEQLKPGGHMVLPIGEPNSQQMLLLVTKNKERIINTESILPVAFVPLVSSNDEVTYL